MISLTLKVVGGDVDTKEIPLRLPAIVGRGHDVAVNLTHPLVSRRHCELREADGAVVVRDLASLNGTYIGSQRVDEGVLRDGDLLTIGTVTFRAVYQDATSQSLGSPSVGDASRLQHTVRSASGAEHAEDPSKVETVRYHGAQPAPAPHKSALPSRQELQEAEVFAGEQGLAGEDATTLGGVSSGPAAGTH